jgi:hypothetical protein
MLLVLGRLSPRRSRVSFDWAGGYSFLQAMPQGSFRGAFAAVDQQIRACVAVAGWRSGKLDTCAGAVWGAVLPETRGRLLREQSDAYRPYAGPTAAVALQLWQGGNAVRLEAGAAVPLRRYTFSYLSVGGDSTHFYTTGAIIVFVRVAGLRTIL